MKKNFFIWIFAFAPIAANANNVTQQQFEQALQACGGGLSAEANSTFQTAFDAASSQTPGTGVASVNVLGMQLVRTIDGLQSDEAKVAVLQAYYQCITPVLASQFTGSNSGG